MAVPKSVVKINKDGVTYTSSVDRTKFLLVELERAALRDTAKYIRTIIKNNILVFRGTLRDNVGTWVRKAKDTGQVELQVGIYSTAQSKKKGKRPAIHAHFLEFGTSKMTAKPFLKPSVYENIAEIRKIQGQYLSKVEDENAALALVEEEEEIE